MKLLEIIGLLFAATLSTMWFGYVLHILWAWFLVPIGLPAVTMVSAIGISITIKMIVAGLPNTKDNPDYQYLVIYSFIYPLMSLALGWIAVQFV